MKIYLSGPMTGIENLNAEAFNEAEKKLKNEGHKVINPIQLATELDTEFYYESKLIPSYKDYLLNDIHHISFCDKLVLLPGWEQSKGAKAEKAIAEAIGIEIEELKEELE